MIPARQRTNNKYCTIRRQMLLMALELKSSKDTNCVSEHQNCTDLKKAICRICHSNIHCRFCLLYCGRWCLLGACVIHDQKYSNSTLLIRRPNFIVKGSYMMHNLGGQAINLSLFFLFNISLFIIGKYVSVIQYIILYTIIRIRIKKSIMQWNSIIYNETQWIRFAFISDACPCKTINYKFFILSWDYNIDNAHLFVVPFSGGQVVNVNLPCSLSPNIVASSLFNIKERGLA